MIVINERQISTMLAGMRSQYLPKIEGYLRKNLPTQIGVLDDATLAETVHASMARAAAWGIEIEWDFCRFAYLDLIHGPRFDERCPWAARLLSKQGLSGTDRMDLVESYHRNYLDGAGGIGAAGGG
jgi:hypothetical protein